MDRRLALGALAEPARARALRIQIHQRGLEPADGEVTGEIDRDRGFARTTLGIEDDDLLHAGCTSRFDSGSLRSGTNRCKRSKTVTNEHCPAAVCSAELRRNQSKHPAKRITGETAGAPPPRSVTMFTGRSGRRCESSHIPPGLLCVESLRSLRGTRAWNFCCCGPMSWTTRWQSCATTRRESSVLIAALALFAATGFALVYAPHVTLAAFAVILSATLFEALRRRRATHRRRPRNNPVSLPRRSGFSPTLLLSGLSLDPQSP